MSTLEPALAPPAFPYELRQKAGEGAMGVVYEAWDPDLGRRVAVKLMREAALEGLAAGARQEARLRFVQEARAAARLAHPGIATVYRIGETNGRPFIAMEWLEGENVESLLASGAPLPPATVARLGVELAEALEAAHRAGVVHRDIKPSNLVVTLEGRLKVTDFGIARIEGLELVRTRAGEVMATPLYASPEQLHGEGVDGRTDVFSAGIVLYLALTGRHPFAGATLAEVTTAVIQRNPPPVSALNPDVPAGLDAVVETALAKDRSRRHARAADLADALRPFAASGLGGTRPLRRPPPPPSVAARPETQPAVAAAASRVLVGLPADPAALVAAVVAAWPARPVAPGPVPALLARLAETPLHAEPFAGAVVVGGRSLLLFEGGWLLAALDTTSGLEGDAVVEGLPAEAGAELRAAPPGLPGTVVRLLASLVRPRKVRYEGLDSTFANLPALARRLREERFSGVFTLRRREGDEARILVDRGRDVLALFSGAWPGVATDAPWESWVSDVLVAATVEEPASEPVAASFRLQLADAAVEVVAAPGRSLASSPRSLLATGLRRSPGGASPPGRHLKLLPPDTAAARSAGGSDETRARSFDLDGTRRLLAWLLDEAPAALARLGKEQKLKYLAQWIPLVARARLHHRLPRPGSAQSDPFDLVTTDAAGKVLHLADRVAHGTAETLRAFAARVVEAKKARIKTGDVGAALLVAASFDEEVTAVYQGLTTHEEDARRSWAFGALEAMTSYEGFVRIGPRRGFHLVLVVESPAGLEVALP